MRLDHLLLGRTDKVAEEILIQFSVDNGNSLVSFLFVFNKSKLPEKKGSVIFGNGGIAQLVEHLPCKQGVIGSNPITSTIYGLIAQLVRAHA